MSIYIYICACIYIYIYIYACVCVEIEIDRDRDIVPGGKHGVLQISAYMNIDRSIDRPQTLSIDRTRPMLPHTTSAVSAFPEDDVRSSLSVCV